jgi:integrase/recombinase XerD
MKGTKELFHHIQNFFQNYLSNHRGLSANTLITYRDALKLFLAYVVKHTDKQIMKITLDDLTAEVTLAFLDDIEKNRGNRVITRNLRLAALRSFFSYLVTQDTFRTGQYQKIIAIPLKKAPSQVMDYLETDELKTILGTIDRTTLLGRRDHTLLNLLYNTGARVQEICNLRVKDLHLDPPQLITITGKGQKTRQVPVWPETAALLKAHLCERGVIHDLQAILFVNARGEPLGRFGIRHIIRKRTTQAIKKCPGLATKKISPHTFRHTTAMHLLQSGVDLSIIKSWLGHVNLSTTHAYVEIDLNMKRKALAACTPMGSTQDLQQFIDRNKDIISWLESL